MEVIPLGFDLSLFTHDLMKTQAAKEVLSCNDYTSRYGLILTQAQAMELVETRARSLSENGRIEFGGGAIDKIIREFCDSPYLSAGDYADTLHELTEIFYAYKNETLDLLPDDELIKAMKTAFDGSCQGSLELLKSRELYKLAKRLRYGLSAEDDEDEDEFCEDEEEFDA
jgi:hypothetical protein